MVYSVKGVGFKFKCYLCAALSLYGEGGYLAVCLEVVHAGTGYGLKQKVGVFGKSCYLVVGSDFVHISVYFKILHL